MGLLRIANERFVLLRTTWSFVARISYLFALDELLGLLLLIYCDLFALKELLGCAGVKVVHFSDNNQLQQTVNLLSG